MKHARREAKKSERKERKRAKREMRRAKKPSPYFASLHPPKPRKKP